MSRLWRALRRANKNTFALIGLTNDSGVVWGSLLPGGCIRSCADGEGLRVFGWGMGGVEEGDSGFLWVSPSASAHTDGAPSLVGIRLLNSAGRELVCVGNA
jgi:hypothetical protein